VGDGDGMSYHLSKLLDSDASMEEGPTLCSRNISAMFHAINLVAVTVAFLVFTSGRCLTSGGHTHDIVRTVSH
jgi:hypothetical protein